MTHIDRPDNRPLARYAVWLLVDALIVFAVSITFLMRPDFFPDAFDHPPFQRLGVIIVLTLFTLLTVTSSVLGFLANCQTGKTTGVVAVVVLIAGWLAFGLLVLS
jgi:hypothetical protein